MEIMCGDRDSCLAWYASNFLLPWTAASFAPEHLICIRHAFYLIAGKMLRSRAALAGFQDSMSVCSRFKCL